MTKTSTQTKAESYDIRCGKCGKTSSAANTACPNCGRELHLRKRQNPMLVAVTIFAPACFLSARNAILGLHDGDMLRFAFAGIASLLCLVGALVPLGILLCPWLMSEEHMPRHIGNPSEPWPRSRRWQFRIPEEAEIAEYRGALTLRLAASVLAKLAIVCLFLLLYGLAAHWWMHAYDARATAIENMPMDSLRGIRNRGTSRQMLTMINVTFIGIGVFLILLSTYEILDLLRRNFVRPRMVITKAGIVIPECRNEVAEVFVPADQITGIEQTSPKILTIKAGDTSYTINNDYYPRTRFHALCSETLSWWDAYRAARSGV